MPAENPDLLQLFAAFEETRAEYNAAVAGGSVPRKLTEKLYSRAYLVMLAYCHPSNWPAGLDANPIHPFPPLLATLVRWQVHSIIAGDISGPIRDLMRRGKPSRHPVEHLDQGWAVAYVGAVKAGVVKDTRPNDTVTEAFNINLRTLQRWRKEQIGNGGHWRDIVPNGVPEDKVGEVVSARMREAGARYLQKGPLATSREKPDGSCPMAWCNGSSVTTTSG